MRDMWPLEGDGAQGQDDRMEDEERGEESHALRPAHDPGMRKREEVAKHEIGPLPYRERCAHCVRGRGRCRPHCRGGDGERGVLILAAAYCYMGQGGGGLREGEPLVLVITDQSVAFA